MGGSEIKSKEVRHIRKVFWASSTKNVVKGGLNYKKETTSAGEGGRVSEKTNKKLRSCV